MMWGDKGHSYTKRHCIYGDALEEPTMRNIGRVREECFNFFGGRGGGLPYTIKQDNLKENRQNRYLPYCPVCNFNKFYGTITIIYIISI